MIPGSAWPLSELSYLYDDLQSYVLGSEALGLTQSSCLINVP